MTVHNAGPQGKKCSFFGNARTARRGSDPSNHLHCGSVVMRDLIFIAVVAGLRIQSGAARYAR
jgi:hypothetical protein